MNWKADVNPKPTHGVAAPTFAGATQFDVGNTEAYMEKLIGKIETAASIAARQAVVALAPTAVAGSMVAGPAPNALVAPQQHSCALPTMPDEYEKSSSLATETIRAARQQMGSVSQQMPTGQSDMSRQKSQLLALEGPLFELYAQLESEHDDAESAFSCCSLSTENTEFSPEPCEMEESSPYSSSLSCEPLGPDG
jgi:hypothetical protein